MNKKQISQLVDELGRKHTLTKIRCAMDVLAELVASEIDRLVPDQDRQWRWDTDSYKQVVAHERPTDLLLAEGRHWSN